jgi:hypothetical protein
VITEVRELFQRSYQVGRTRTYRRVFYVGLDDPKTSPGDVRTAVWTAYGVDYGATYPGDSLAVVTELLLDQNQDDGLDYKVTATYGENPQTSGNPLLEAAEVEVDFVRFERTMDRDIDGKPVVNAVGDPFAEAVTRDDSRPVLRISRNEASVPIGAMLYRDCVNADDFFGFPPGTCKMSPPKTKRVVTQDFGTYWTVSYEFEVQPEGWQKHILNAGYRQKGQDGKLRMILNDGDQTPISDPVPLSGDGRRIPPGGTPVYLDFTPYASVPFSVLGLE